MLCPQRLVFVVHACMNVHVIPPPPNLVQATVLFKLQRAEGS